MTEPPLLEISGLYARHGRAEVVHGIDLVLGAGQIVTIIGPNGAGKTTTMHAIMGLLPTSGSMRYLGAEISGAQTEALVARGLVLVPESRALFTDMSIADNLQLGGYQRRRQGYREEAADLRRVFTLFPRLEERRRQLAGTLSGGERQMLALGRALMARPRVLLLDEPSLGLAPRIVRDILRTLDGLRRDGLSILLVEQNARAALQVADYGYVLEMGEIVASGPSAELAANPRVLETYLGHRQDAAPGGVA